MTKIEEEEEFYMCPHGRLPSENAHGWQSCPHCLGINEPNEHIRTK